MTEPTAGWPRPSRPCGTVTLGFGPADPALVANLSAATRIGDTLFVGADEQAVLHRLIRDDDGAWRDRGAIALAELLPLAWPGEEADIEGLAADDRWLWVVGSHARARRKPERAPGESIDLHRLAALKDTRARCLLARLPLVEHADGWMPVRHDGGRRAGMVAQSKHGNALRKALIADPLMAPFTRIPAKEGGVDIEGIAIHGDRVALGMRGPVLGTHAVLLEMRIAARPSGRLTLRAPPLKRLLAMEGLGIRDLKRRGDDLLILAGPTMGLSGPCALYRWRDWANDPPQDARQVRLHRPERIVELPFGCGVDHPEALALWDDGPRGRGRILVIDDSPADRRLDHAAGTILADLFTLPA